MNDTIMYTLEITAAILVQLQVYYLYTQTRAAEKFNRDNLQQIANVVYLLELTNARMDRKERLPEERPFQSAEPEIKKYRLHLAERTDGNHN